MIEGHKLDKRMSQHVYEKCGSIIERKQCYTNVFHTIRHFSDSYRNNGWKIAYGYIRAVKNIYVRHCFIVDGESKAIDPTIATFGDRKNDDHDHMSFITLEVNEYLEKLLKNNGDAAFFGQFEKEEEKMKEWARHHVIILSG